MNEHGFRSGVKLHCTLYLLLKHKSAVDDMTVENKSILRGKLGKPGLQKIAVKGRIVTFHLLPSADFLYSLILSERNLSLE